MNRNHLIVFNSIVMQVKTVLTIVLSFLTSRYVLELLGVESYGLYYLIAGVTATFEFLCSSMVSTTSRYFTLAQSEGNIERANIVFNTIRSNNQRLIVLILSIIEVFGLIMILGVLSIPEGSFWTCIFIFQIMVVDTYFKLKVIPYNSLLTAKENFLFINIVSVSQSIAKLVFVLALFAIPDGYRLISYSITILFISFVARFITQRYVTKKYEEAYIDVDRIDHELKENAFSFLKFSWVGQLSDIIRVQGTNFLLNIFTGTVTINAAFGVAKRLTAVTDMAFTPISNTILPQTLKSYSEKNYARFEKLTFFNSKLAVFLSWIVIIPLFVEADFVFDIWLKEVPEYAVMIARLVLIAEMIRQLYNGLSMSFLVSDKIKKIYVIQTAIRAIAFIILIMVLVINKSNALIVFGADIVVMVLYLLVYLLFMQELIGISPFKYFRRVLIPAIGSVILMLVLFYLKSYFCVSFITNLIYSLLIVVVIALYFYLCLLSKTEKQDTKLILRSFIKKVRK